MKSNREQSARLGTGRQDKNRKGLIGVFLLICFCSGVVSFPAPHRMTMKADVGTSSKTQIKQLLGSNFAQSSNNIPPGSPLSMLILDQQEFELEVGHAMDVLRNDYPTILTTNPDFSIYDPDLELIDPSGVHLAGVHNYKAAFRLLHAVVGIFYCSDRSILKHRMCFDKARQNIRIHWNAEIIPKAIFGGQRSTLHVDGISVYEISRVSGNITQHRIERLIINDTPVLPEKGIFAALRGYAVKKNVDGVPVFNTGLETMTETGVVPFRNFHPLAASALLDQHEDEDSSTLQPLAASSPGSTEVSYDPFMEALEKKNAARKKFGLAPLTAEEFAELQEQVRQLDAQQQQRSAAAAAEMAAKKKKEDEGRFLKKMLGNVLEDTCDSNYDCERPQICCDFGFKKMCCTSGMRVVDGPRSRQGQYAEIPVIANPGPNYPQDYPPRRY